MPSIYNGESEGKGTLRVLKIKPSSSKTKQKTKKTKRRKQKTKTKAEKKTFYSPYDFCRNYSILKSNKICLIKNSIVNYIDINYCSHKKLRNDLRYIGLK